MLLSEHLGILSSSRDDLVPGNGVLVLLLCVQFWVVKLWALVSPRQREFAKYRSALIETLEVKHPCLFKTFMTDRPTD